MPKNALLFIGLVVASGTTVLVSAAATWPAISDAFVVCLLLAMIGATFKVRIPGMAGTISPINVPILFAAGTLGWQETVVIAATAGIVQCIWRTGNFPKPNQIAFNGATLALAAGVAREVAVAIAPPSTFLLYVTAAIVLHAVNAMAVSTVLSLIGRERLRSVWRNCHLWSFPYELAAGAFAAVLAQSTHVADYRPAVLGAVLLYLMSSFYREIVQRVSAGRG